MRGKERLNSWLFSILALIMVASIVLSVGHAAKVQNLLAPSDIVNFANVQGIITDRFDQPIFEDKVKNYSIFGNLLGYKNHIENSVLFKFSKELAPGSVNFITGYRSLEKDPRILKTTLLSEESQAELVKLYEGLDGCCFAYNYETGDIYTALSFPQYSPEIENPSYVNKCFDGIFIPGSTMKIVTLILALDQGVNLKDIEYDCPEVLVLPNGQKIVCENVHGHVDITSAIGVSCNGFFAKVIEHLNVEEALETLKTMGFSVNDSEIKREGLGKMSKTVSSVMMTNTSSFENVWGLIGQGRTRVNVMDMAMIAGAVANNGKAANPRLVSSIINPNKKNKEIYKEDSELIDMLTYQIAKNASSQWAKSTKEFYNDTGKLDSRITYAKTGTAELDNGKIINKYLIGAIEESKVAFFIAIEDYRGGITPQTVANKLVQILP